MNELVKQAHQNAVEHGWWDEERSFGEVIALMHSELSEALEEYRKGHKPDEIYFSKDGVEYGMPWPDCKPDGIPIELADVVIRIFDACGRYGIDLDDAVKTKMEYNKTRPYKHGKKI